MAGVLSYIAGVLFVITVSDACKCAVVHPQTSFCIADFGEYNLHFHHADSRARDRVSQFSFKLIWNGYIPKFATLSWSSVIKSSLFERLREQNNEQQLK